MALKDKQERFKAVMTAIETEQDETRLEELLTEGETLKAEIATAQKNAGRAADLRSFGSKSAGMLPLSGVGEVTVHGMTKSGETVIENRGESILINSEGEGILGDKLTGTLRDPEYGKAFKAMLRGPRVVGGVRFNDAIKTLQEGLDASGGYLVPEDLQNRIIAKAPAPTSLVSRVQRLTTSRDVMVMPKLVWSTDDTYTNGMRVTWGGELPASATSHRVTEPVFGNMRIPVYTAMMSLPLSNDFIEDSASDVVGFCSQKFSETIDLLRENMILNGTGIGQPAGILRNPNGTDEPAEVASGAAAALTWSGLQDLVWALPEQYDNNAALVFNKTSTGLAISKLVDGDGRPLWSQGVGDSGLVGSPQQRQLLGYPVNYSAMMPSVAADAHVIVFGDLRGYALVDRVGFSISVLRELYAETNIVLLLGRVRFGGAVMEPWRLKVQAVSA